MSRRFSPILQKKIANSTTSRLQNITSEPRGESFLYQHVENIFKRRA